MGFYQWTLKGKPNWPMGKISGIMAIGFVDHLRQILFWILPPSPQLSRVKCNIKEVTFWFWWWQKSFFFLNLLSAIKEVYYINHCISCDQWTNGTIWKSFEKFSLFIAVVKYLCAEITVKQVSTAVLKIPQITFQNDSFLTFPACF